MVYGNLLYAASFSQKSTIMKKTLILMMMLVSLAAFRTSASRTISGTVYGSNDKKPLPGVSIKVDGTAASTTTDAKGYYSVSVPNGKTNLVFKFIGYESQTIKIGKADIINVWLKIAATALNKVTTTQYKCDTMAYKASAYPLKSLQEVVVTGYGTAIKDKTQQIDSYGNQANQAATSKIQRGRVMITGALNAKAYFPPVTAPTDESYSEISENGFLDPKSTPLSTFAVDVDAASYSNFRRFINSGQLPPKDAVRIEEMVNYFHYDLPEPTNGDPVAIHTELSAAPWNPEHRLLRIGLKAKTVKTASLPPSNLVFLLDVSGSMGEPNKLPLVKASMKMLVDQLRPVDHVAIVVYAGEAGLKLPSTPGDEKTKIKDVIDGLEAGGSTAGGAGIIMAYQIAKDKFIKGGNNRIILATDGDFNVGASSDKDMGQLIQDERQTGVSISILGFGMGNLKDSKMETMADKGHGNYAYIDNITEATKAMISEFGGTFFTVAKDVKMQIEFNPAKVQAYRLLGYEDRLLNKEDFNNDKKAAGDMGVGHTVTALYEIIPAGLKDSFTTSVDPLKYQKTNEVALNNSPEMVTIKFRYKQPDSDKSKMELVAVKDEPKALSKTTDDFRFAAAVAELGMLLRDSEFKQKSSFSGLIGMARDAKGKDDEGYRAEFIRLAESAKLMSKSPETASEMKE